MIKTIENDICVLTAEEGFMVTNGEVYGKKVFLSHGDNEENWYETEEIEHEY